MNWQFVVLMISVTWLECCQGLNPPIWCLLPPPPTLQTPSGFTSNRLLQVLYEIHRDISWHPVQWWQEELPRIVWSARWKICKNIRWSFDVYVSWNKFCEASTTVVRPVGKGTRGRISNLDRWAEVGCSPHLWRLSNHFPRLLGARTFVSAVLRQQMARWFSIFRHFPTVRSFENHVGIPPDKRRLFFQTTTIRRVGVPSCLPEDIPVWRQSWHLANCRSPNTNRSRPCTTGTGRSVRESWLELTDGLMGSPRSSSEHHARWSTVSPCQTLE